MAGPSERAFETAICESLVSSGGYSAVTVQGPLGSTGAWQAIRAGTWPTTS